MLTTRGTRAPHRHDGGQVRITWRSGNAVERTATVVRREVVARNAVGEIVRYPDLAKALHAAWLERGAHRDATDRRLDQLSIHIDNRAPFRLLIAMVDAVNTTKRPLELGGSTLAVPAFNVTLRM